MTRVIEHSMIRWLHELVAELYQCSRQTGCDLCGMKEVMRELGIEVDK